MKTALNIQRKDAHLTTANEKVRIYHLQSRLYSSTVHWNLLLQAVNLEKAQSLGLYHTTGPSAFPVDCIDKAYEQLRLRATTQNAAGPGDEAAHQVELTHDGSDVARVVKNIKTQLGMR